MHPLLETQDILHTEAQNLLEEILLPLLKKFGDVSVGGSYVYGLMSWPDLDLGIHTEKISKAVYIELCTTILALEGISKLTTTNRGEFSRMVKTGNQKGYWIGLQFLHKETLWNIDIWFQKPEWNADTSLEYHEKLRSIDDETRIVILTLKNELKEKGLYGVSKEFQSVDVYNAVLEREAKTIEDVRNYKASR